MHDVDAARQAAFVGKALHRHREMALSAGGKPLLDFGAQFMNVERCRIDQHIGTGADRMQQLLLTGDTVSRAIGGR